ncbi:hypothetical protein GCM10027256_02970 [Novispirillum itersonii subsp. nipponicum]
MNTIPSATTERSDWARRLSVPKQTERSDWPIEGPSARADVSQAGGRPRPASEGLNKTTKRSDWPIEGPSARADVSQAGGRPHPASEGLNKTTKRSDWPIEGPRDHSRVRQAGRMARARRLRDLTKPSKVPAKP